MTVVIQMSYSVGGGPWEERPVRLLQAFDRFAGNLKTSMKFIAPELTELLERTVKARFEKQGEGGPVSGKWAELSEEYKAWKDIHYPGQPVLVRTGALRDALTDSGSSGAFRESTNQTFGFGTRGIEYASFHQTGTSHKKSTRKMPPRPPFDFGGTEFQRGLIQASRKGIIKAIRAAGLKESSNESAWRGEKAGR